MNRSIHLLKRNWYKFAPKKALPSNWRCPKKNSDPDVLELHENQHSSVWMRVCQIEGSWAMGSVMQGRNVVPISGFLNCKSVTVLANVVPNLGSLVNTHATSFTAGAGAGPAWPSPTLLPVSLYLYPPCVCVCVCSHSNLCYWFLCRITWASIASTVYRWSFSL